MLDTRIDTREVGEECMMAAGVQLVIDGRHYFNLREPATVRQVIETSGRVVEETAAFTTMVGDRISLCLEGKG